MKRIALLLAASLALCTLTGCQVERGFVAKDYVRVLREQQILPVFPPREDVQVGDVYLLSSSNREQEKAEFARPEFLEIDVWLKSIDLTTELQAHYAKRYEFPITPAERTEVTNTPREPAEARAPSGKSVFDNRTSVERLPGVAFPEFAFVAATSAEARALVPINGLPARFSGAYSKIAGASLKLRASESYGLPLDVLHASVKDQLKVGVPNEVLEWAGEGRLFRVVQEVFLTREIEITAYLQEGGGGSAGVSVFGGANSLPERPTGSEPSTQTPADELKAVNELLKDQEGPGGYIQIISATANQITMKRVFNRPIAVGVRCADYKISNDIATLVDNRTTPVVGIKGGSFEAKRPPD